VFAERGAEHFLFDISDTVIADYALAAILRKLEENNWTRVLRSTPAPGVVTFSREGYSFS
jgi:hypothetical protein